MELILIRPAQLEQELEMRQGYLLDIRNQEEYQKDHIKGALNVPAEQLEQYVRQHNRQKFFVLYCERGILSLKAGRKLAREGFHIGALAGGLNGYRENERNRYQEQERSRCRENERNRYQEHERNRIDSLKRNLYDNKECKRGK